MTPNELAAALREHNAWRRGEGKYGNELAPETMPFSPPQLGEILDQAADALEACAQQAEVWAEWQPIETAPRDGKVFLSFGPKGIHPTYWGCVHGGGHPENGPAIYWWCSDQYEFDDGPYDAPTHWKPIDLPQTDNGGE